MIHFFHNGWGYATSLQHKKMHFEGDACLVVYKTRITSGLLSMSGHFSLYSACGVPVTVPKLKPDWSVNVRGPLSEVIVYLTHPDIPAVPGSMRPFINSRNDRQKPGPGDFWHFGTDISVGYRLPESKVIFLNKLLLIFQKLHLCLPLFFSARVITLRLLR